VVLRKAIRKVRSRSGPEVKLRGVGRGGRIVEMKSPNRGWLGLIFAKSDYHIKLLY